MNSSHDFRSQISNVAYNFHYRAPQQGPTYSPFTTQQYVVGIVGHNTEDDLALLVDGGHHPEAYFVLIDPDKMHFCGNTPVIDGGLIYKNRRFIFVDFQPGLIVSYLVNYNSQPFCGRTLDIPCAVQDEVNNYLFRKNITSSILRNTGLLTPREICLTLMQIRADGVSEHINKDTNPRIEARTQAAPNNVYIDYHQLVSGHIRAKLLSDFLASHACDEGVLKPNNGGHGDDVHFFNREDNEKKEPILQALLFSAQDVLLQERITPPLLVEGPRRLDWNLRVFISRDKTGRAVAREMFVRMQEQGGPVNIAKGAKVCLLEEIAHPLGWNKATLREVRDRALQSSARAYEAICGAIAQDSPHGQATHSPDILGADLIIRREKEQWRVYIIEMDINPGGTWDLNHRLQQLSSSQTTRVRQSLKAREGGTHHDWIRLMIQRCHQHTRVVQKNAAYQHT